MDGIDTEPAGGDEECAVFTALTAGNGVVVITYFGTNNLFPQCDESLEVRIPITVRRMSFSVSKEYLGINMVDPIMQPQGMLSAQGSLWPEKPDEEYVWELTGSTVFDPTPGGDDTKAVIKEIGIPSTSYQGETVSMSKGCGSGTARFTAVQVDVDMGKGEGEEQKPGHFIRLNDNDSDGSGFADLSEAPLLSEDNDLVPITISIYPANLPGDQVITLSGSGNCYEDAMKIEHAKPYYLISQLPPCLYLEGNRTGVGSFSAVHSLSGARDMAVYTVLKCDLLVDSDNDGEIDSSVDDALEMAAPGLLLGVNCDDDNGNMVADRDDNVEAVESEDDLKEMLLSYEPFASRGHIQLSAPVGGSCVKIWKTPDKGGASKQIFLPRSWPLSNQADPVPSSVYIEGVASGDVVLRLAYEVEGIVVYEDEVRLTVLGPSIVPNANRDRKIDSEDEGQITFEKPFRFWINDDDDMGDIASDDGDVPEQSASNADYNNARIDGRADLLDFFPVWLDLGGVLKILPPGEEVQYRLKQVDAAVKVVYTDLARNHAGNYLISDDGSFGPSLNQDSYCAYTIPVTPSGTLVPECFLDEILSDGGRGVVLLEGTKSSTAPLILEVWKNGHKICTTELPLSISGVEDMYRWINLRHITDGGEGRETEKEPPKNYPDHISNGKQFVFVHGYNVDEHNARGTNAEMFKRLFQSGSRAMFTAVIWRGDETPGVLPPAAYYHADVINAFQTASALVSEVANLPGEKYIGAHSLGNMLVSSAIVDHGLNPQMYFMVDAAVAMEAYKSTESHPLEIEESPWTLYTNRLWASNWYKLFDEPDGRHYLSWRGRFGNISQAINYYSSGEDVLNNNDPPENMYVPRTEKAWVFQEKMKGGVLPDILKGVDSHGGWGFNGEYGKGVYDPINDLYVIVTTPDEAALLPEYMLRTYSFFKPFYDKNLYGDAGSELAANFQVRSKVLAEAIPATSRAIGRNKLNDWGDSRNVDLMTMRSGWPRSNENWLHSDFKNVAFPYVHQFFKDMVDIGGLQCKE